MVSALPKCPRSYPEKQITDEARWVQRYWRNPTEEGAELLLVLQAPEPTEELVRRHFARLPSVAHIR